MASAVARRLWSVGPFELGGLAAAGGAMISLIALGYVVPFLGPTALTFLSFYGLEMVLLPLVTLALFRASRRQRSSSTKAFFLRLSLAYLAWSTVALLRWPLIRFVGAAQEDLVRDILYAAYYVAILWAIEWAPREDTRPIAERRIALAGSLLLVVGSLLYIRIIPGLALSVDDQAPYVALYVLLDGYLAIRLGVLALRAQSSGLRLTFALLAVSNLGHTISNALELLYIVGYSLYSEASLWNLVWLVPYPWIFLATHVRRIEPEVTEAGNSLTSPQSHLSLLWSPLIAYGFALPAIHVILYASGLGVPEAERSRALFVVLWLTALGLLILVQRAAIAGRVLSAERALHESYEQIRELTAVREAAVDEERKRLARDLADGPGRQLMALRTDLTWLDLRQSHPTPGPQDRMEAASKLAVDALESAHRIASGLRPRTLDESGLPAALRELVAATTAPGLVDVRLISDDETPNLNPEAEIELYRIAQEGLTNCLKHSGARRIELELSTTGARTELEVRDDGVGVAEGFASDPSGIGLLSMRERAHAAGGSLILGSGIGGRGFSVRVRLDSRASSSGSGQVATSSD